MKILYVKTYHYPRGGPWRHYHQVKRVLEVAGHTVIPFSMQHPLNEPSVYSRFFVSYIDFANANRAKNIRNVLKICSRSIFCLEARRKIKRLVDEVKPDIAHIHAFLHHFTPSIIKPLLERGIPIVVTPEDYNLLCPNIGFLYEGSVCEKCKQKQFWHCTVQKCKKGSLSASMLATLEAYSWVFWRWWRQIDMVAPQTRFVANKFREFGFCDDRIRIIPPSLPWGDFLPNYDSEPYLCYFGRLSQEKGVDILLRAATIAGDVPLEIIGDGDQKDALQFLSVNLGLTNVNFRGAQFGPQLARIVSNARAVIVPSRWYEILGFTILEAYGWGKPVIGANIGAIPEVVLHGKTGWIFEPGDTQALAACLVEALHNKAACRRMGRRGRAYVEEMFSEYTHYQNLKQAYKDLLARQ